MDFECHNSTEDKNTESGSTNGGPAVELKRVINEWRFNSNCKEECLFYARKWSLNRLVKSKQDDNHKVQLKNLETLAKLGSLNNSGGEVEVITEREKLLEADLKRSKKQLDQKTAECEDIRRLLNILKQSHADRGYIYELNIQQYKEEIEDLKEQLAKYDNKIPRHSYPDTL